MIPERQVFGPPKSRDMDYPRRYTRWVTWGCLTLMLAGALMFAGFALVLVKSPGAMKWMEDLAGCQDRLKELSGALYRYNTDKGHLPESLSELYPTYLPDQINLRCPADKEHKSSTSYVLVKGLKWGKGTGILVYCPHHQVPPAFHGLFGQRSILPVIAQDGKVLQVPSRKGQKPPDRIP